MSTATIGQERTVTSGMRLSFPHLLKSEALKLRTLRSTWITLVIAEAVLVLIALAVSARLHSSYNDPVGTVGRGPNLANSSPLDTPLNGFFIVQLVIAVLGVLSVSGEYSTGMIRATFSAVPKRLPVLWSKLTVFGLLAFVVNLVGVLVAFFVAQAVIGSPHNGSLSSPGALRVVFGVAGYLTLIGLLALAFGFVLRSTAGGIATVVGLVLVVPIVLEAIGSSWSDSLRRYLPSNAGNAMFEIHPDAGTVSPTVGLLVLLAWVVAAIAGAAVLVRSRDA